MRLSFDDGTLLLEDAPNTVPHAEWDDRVEEYRAQAQHYREIYEWATGDGQATLRESTASTLMETFTSTPARATDRWCDPGSLPIEVSPKTN